MPNNPRDQLVKAGYWQIPAAIKKGERSALLFSEDEFFSCGAHPWEDIHDPTAAGDTFAGGMAGYLAGNVKNSVEFTDLRRAMIYGSVLASFNVEAFSMERLRSLTKDEIDERYEIFRTMSPNRSRGLMRFFITLVLYAFCLASLHAGQSWTTLPDCVYVTNPSNDGDSFHVKASDKEYSFRLYFVDAPEINSGNPPRLVEQANYFGITVPQTIELGRSADLYVRDRLAEPFTVITRFAHASGRGKVERFLAFVQTKDGDLGEQLIASGLARIYGTPATPPGLASSAAESEKLAQLQNEAKQKQAGGWGANVERPTKSQSGLTSATSPKLDVNGATKEQLEKLPGIGPVLAANIIAARPMKSADDLQRVNGIGPKKYKTIRSFFD